MTLKAFHVVFVVVSTFISAGFGVWALRAFLASHENVYLFLGSLSLAMAVGLIYYGQWFLRKMKDVRYL